MSKQFCYVCNSETDRFCEICKKPCCQYHDIRFESAIDINNFIDLRDQLFRVQAFLRKLEPRLVPSSSAKSAPPCNSGIYTWITYRHFYEKVVPQLRLPTNLAYSKWQCWPCSIQSSVELCNQLDEGVFPFIHAAQASGALCGMYDWCLGDAGWKCEDCGKNLCRAHVAKCMGGGGCNKTFCTFVIPELDGGEYSLWDREKEFLRSALGFGCNERHRHWFSNTYWRRV